MDIDAKKVMLVLLERQKEYVLEDRENYSCAMVVGFDSNGKSWLTSPRFNGYDEKRAAYSQIVANATARSALLLITVNDARTQSAAAGDPDNGSEDIEFDETNSRPCILVTASGPHLESCSVTLGYEIRGRQVIFDPGPEWLNGIQLNLLPGWPLPEPGSISN